MSYVELSKECIENALKISGYSKYRLAKESGIPLRTIQRWFNTDMRIDYEILLKLCLIMDTEPAYLMEPFQYTESDSDGNPHVIKSYHYSNQFTDKERTALSDEERKRIDPNGVYVRHFSKEDMKFYLRISADWDMDEIMTNYVRAYVRSNLIENSSFISEYPKALPILTRLARDAVDRTISETIKVMMKDADMFKAESEKEDK